MQLFNTKSGSQNFVNIMRGYVVILGQEVALYLKKYLNFHLTIPDLSKLYQNKYKIVNSGKILTCIKTIINLTFETVFDIEGVFYNFIQVYVWDKNRAVTLESIKKVITEQINIPEFDTFKIIDREVLPEIIQGLKTKETDEDLNLYLNGISNENIARLELITPDDTYKYYKLNLFLRLIKDEPEKYRELFKSFKEKLEKKKLAFQQYQFVERMKKKAEKENKRQTKKQR